MKRLLLLLLLAPAFFFSPASAQAQNPTVVGKSYVAVHCKEFEKFIFLRKGQQFDLKNHQILKKPR